MFIKSLCKQQVPLRRYFSTQLYSLISATEKGGEGFSQSNPSGHTSNTRELSFEEQYAAKRDYELLMKLANESETTPKTIFEKIDESQQFNIIKQAADHTNPIIEDTIANTHVGNVDVSPSSNLPPENAAFTPSTPWRNQTIPKKQPIPIQTTPSKEDQEKIVQYGQHQYKFMDKSYYPDLTNDL